MTTTEAEADRRRVRVWFGEVAIADFRGSASQADRHAEAMRRRFPSLPVSNEPLQTEL
jgi:hypothetical protein